jgi:hypothetical protein
MTQLSLAMARNHDGDCTQSSISQDFLAGQSRRMQATAIGAKNPQAVAMYGMAGCDFSIGYLSCLVRGG